MIENSLAAAGWPQPAWFETTAEDTGTGQARQAVADGAEVVFVCGGDGTVRSVIAGLVNTGAALAVLPAGTGNLLATNLGLPDDPAAGVEFAISGGRRRVDVGEVDGEVDGEVFAVMAGIGFDAAMMDHASPTLKAWFGAPAYVVAAVRHLRDRPMRAVIAIDDTPPVHRRVRSVLIGNVGRLQGGIRLLPDAEPDNGQMDVAILAPGSLWHWVQLAVGVLLRRERVPRMQILRGSQIRITSDRVQPRELDGDVIEPGRDLTVVGPGALLLCVAQPDQSPDLAEPRRRADPSDQSAPHQLDRFGPTENRQPPGIGSMLTPLSYSSHSSSATGSRLMARRTGSGTGAGGGGGGAGGDRVARATAATVDRRVRLAPHATHVRPPWFTVSQTPQRQIVFTGTDAPRVCPATSRPTSRSPRKPRLGCVPVQVLSPRCPYRRLERLGHLLPLGRR